MRATGDEAAADAVPLTPVLPPRLRPAVDWIVVHRTAIALHVTAVLVTVFAVRVAGSGFAAGYPPFFPDSSSFAAVARRGPFTGRFWFDERPIGFPLLFWAVGRSVRFVVLAQLAVYVAAFGAVVVVAVRTLRALVAQLLVVAGTVAVAVQPRFALWTTHVLSESLSITTGIAGVAAWWWYATAPTRRRAVLALAASVAFVLVRDSNVIVFAATVAPALGVAGWRRRQTDVGRTLLAGLAVGVVACGYVTIAQDVSDRNIYPVINNVGQRILPDEDLAAWFAARGMPLDQALRAHTGDDAFSAGSAMLTEPALADFRAWAAGPGQRWQLVSFVRHLPSWSGLLSDRLDELLAYDYREYDVFAVADRLGSPGVDGPRSATQLAIGLALAGAGLVVAAGQRRLRGPAAVVAVALAGCLLDGYISFAGDSVEVQRHLVAPLARLSVVLVLAVGLGIERVATRRAADPVPRPEPARPRAVTAVWLATTALATSIVLAAFFGNELRAQDYDPQFMKVLVDRVEALGVTFYEGALHNKGPFEPFVYRVAAALTSDDGFWLAISAFVLVAAGLCAGAVGATARQAGTSRLAAAAVAAGLFVHLTISRADYSGVLYSRNMTVALLAAAWTLALSAWPWRGPARRRLVATAAIGAVLGLSVQTLLTSVFAAAVVAAVALTRIRRDRGPGWRGAGGVLGAAATLTVLAPLAWYALRGRFAEFWGGWWIYGSYQSAGLGRSLFAQFGLAWDQAYAYYRTWPLSAVILVAATVVAIVRWPQLPSAQRTIRLGVAAWVVAAWVELALAQRYSSHYFSILAVPTWLAAATAVADLGALAPARRVRPALRAALPLGVVLAVMYTSTAGEYRTGLAAASDFTGVDDLAAARRAAESGTVRTVRATIDLVSRRGDPLLAWTERPWTYLQWDRIAATRYVWGSFLLGQIYLGGAGPQFVPPHTAEWFAADLARTDPVVFVEEVDHPVPPGTLVGAVVAADFTLLYDGPVSRVYVRDDLAAMLVEPAAGGEPVTAGEELLTGTCRRVDGVLTSGAETRFVVDDASGERGERQYLGVAGGAAWSATDAVELERATWEPPTTAGVPFSLLVGADSVVLVVDGEVRAAVRTWGPVEVGVDAPGGLDGVTVSAFPLAAGCRG